MKTATKEKPILFTGPMVRAIFDGSKTQTRRPVKHTERLPDARTPRRENMTADDFMLCYRSPYQPGDVLWVREKHRLVWDGSLSDEMIEYAAGGELISLDSFEHGISGLVAATLYGDEHACLSMKECGKDSNTWPWRPSIHMKRWMARLFLEVTDVRVQRIQEISREDCHAEGLDEDQLDGGSHCVDGMKSWHVWMMDLWERQYPGSWQRNDWVWCYTFKRGK